MSLILGIAFDFDFRWRSLGCPGAVGGYEDDDDDDFGTLEFLHFGRFFVRCAHTYTWHEETL